MNSDLLISIFAFMVSIFVLFFVITQDGSSEKLMQIGECVFEKSQNQGFTGNPYGQEAWELFSEKCSEDINNDSIAK